MRLDGRRESSNVEDRRGSTVAKAGGLGLGGIIIVGIITLLMGGNAGDVLNNVQQMGGGSVVQQDYTPSAEEEELAVFAKQILAGTEDVWTKVFQEQGLG